MYQPLSACGTAGAGGDLATMGSADSYDFVWAAFERLARSVGVAWCDLVSRGVGWGIGWGGVWGGVVWCVGWCGVVRWGGVGWVRFGAVRRGGGVGCDVV